MFLIKTKKQLRFGGFISVLINGKDKLIQDNDAFCFSLTLNKIYNKIQKYPYSIWDSGKEIITFLLDIFKIVDNFFVAQSICNDGDREIYYDNQQKKYEINGGEKNFIVQVLEVFEVIFIWIKIQIIFYFNFIWFFLKNSSSLLIFYFCFIFFYYKKIINKSCYHKKIKNLRVLNYS